uniref:type IIL restriction-modification enzyme MmeI n=1 Tax=Salinibacterium sp. TMP30 TaxID=3138237 RepID=UPI004053EA1D
MQNAHPSSKRSANQQPTTDYIAVPLLSSEDREYVPVSLFTPETIVNNLVSESPWVSFLGFLLGSGRSQE